MQNNVIDNTAHQTRALKEKAAAEYIGMSVSYLRKDRMDGKVADRTIGPRWAKVGKRVVYLREDLDAWLEQHLVPRKLDS